MTEAERILLCQLRKAHADIRESGMPLEERIPAVMEVCRAWNRIMGVQRPVMPAPKPEPKQPKVPRQPHPITARIKALDRITSPADNVALARLVSWEFLKLEKALANQGKYSHPYRVDPHPYASSPELPSEEAGVFERNPHVFTDPAWSQVFDNALRLAPRMPDRITRDDLKAAIASTAPLSEKVGAIRNVNAWLEGVFFTYRRKQKNRKSQRPGPTDTFAGTLEGKDCIPPAAVQLILGTLLERHIPEEDREEFKAARQDLGGMLYRCELVPGYEEKTREMVIRAAWHYSRLADHARSLCEWIREVHALVAYRFTRADADGFMRAVMHLYRVPLRPMVKAGLFDEHGSPLLPEIGAPSRLFDDYTEHPLLEIYRKLIDVNLGGVRVGSLTLGKTRKHRGRTQHQCRCSCGGGSLWVNQDDLFSARVTSCGSCFSKTALLPGSAEYRQAMRQSRNAVNTRPALTFREFLFFAGLPRKRPGKHGWHLHRRDHLTNGGPDAPYRWGAFEWVPAERNTRETAKTSIRDLQQVIEHPAYGFLPIPLAAQKWAAELGLQESTIKRRLYAWRKHKVPDDTIRNNLYLLRNTNIDNTDKSIAFSVYGTVDTLL